MMIICSILILFKAFDLATGAIYTCDSRSACGCSKRSTIMLSKIVGGESVTVPHSWGWLGSLRRDGLHQCGASLISPLHALTAAHCVHDIKSLSTLSLNFATNYLTNIGELYNISKVFIHPSYNQRLFANDLAILRLDKPVNLSSSNISVLCLPAPSEYNLQLAEYPPIGESLIAIGWGSMKPFIRIPSPVLQQVTIEAIGKTESACLNSIYDDVVQFCAGVPEGGKDTCQGDSGGPLMLFKNGRWELVGITSYGEVCAAAGLAGVYTRVAYYNSYIQSTLQADNQNIRYSKQMEEEFVFSSDASNIRQVSLIYLLTCLYILYKI